MRMSIKYVCEQKHIIQTISVEYPMFEEVVSTSKNNNAHQSFHDS